MRLAEPLRLNGVAASTSATGCGSIPLAPHTWCAGASARSSPTARATSRTCTPSVPDWKADRDHFLGVGMDAYLTKPIKSGELTQILAQWIRPL